MILANFWNICWVTPQLLNEANKSVVVAGTMFNLQGEVVLWSPMCKAMGTM